MRHSEYSSVDSKTGDVRWDGSLSLEKGDHAHMPTRSDVYLPGDERGHVNASSLGGDNTTANVTAQHADVNHGAYYSMEQGERSALQNGASIDSTKTAVVNGQPGDRPETFVVSDQVTYADGHTESIHHSFANEAYAEQQAWSNQSAALPGAFEADNPGDGLRGSMSTDAYADLMESTDMELPGIAEDYAAADFSGLPGADDSLAEASADTGTSFGEDSGAVCGTDDSGISCGMDE